MIRTPEVKTYSCGSCLFSVKLVFIVVFIGLFFSVRVFSMEKIKIALAQVKCIDSDLEGNFNRIKALVIRARSEEAKMLFFPETVDLGWVNPEAHRLAGPVPKEFRCWQKSMTSGSVSVCARNRGISCMTRPC